MVSSLWHSLRPVSNLSCNVNRVTELLSSQAEWLTLIMEKNTERLSSLLTLPTRAVSLLTVKTSPDLSSQSEDSTWQNWRLTSQEVLAMDMFWRNLQSTTLKANGKPVQSPRKLPDSQHAKTLLTCSDSVSWSTGREDHVKLNNLLPRCSERRRESPRRSEQMSENPCLSAPWPT